MQAQAGGGAGGSGGGGESILQNKKVQIGVIAAGAVAIIVVIVMMIMPSGGGSADVGPAVDPAQPAAQSPSMAADGAPAPAGPGAYTAAPSPGGDNTLSGASPSPSPAAPSPVATGSPGTPPPAGGAAAAGREATPARPSAGVRTRANPFEANNDLQAAIDSIPKATVIELPETMAPELHVYSELYTPKPATSVGGGEGADPFEPPIPPMRVAGVVFGNQVTATLQIGSEFIQVRPGQMIPDGNPVYRVERIEQDRIELVRRWQRGERKGVQRFEVTLQGGSQQQRAGMPGMYGGGAPGRPGMNGPGGNGAF